MNRRQRQPRRLFVRLVALITLLNGALNLSLALNPRMHVPHGWLRWLTPLEFLHFPRSWTLLIGFVLVVASVNIWQRKRRAWQIVMPLSALAVLLHLLKGHDAQEALLSLLLIGLLWWLRAEFSVRSQPPDWRSGLFKLGLALLATFGYGAAGFWLLDRREFGVNFNWLAALRQTFRYLVLTGDPALVPHTHYAQWFLDSLFALSVLMLGYVLVSLFRPILWRYRTLPQERALAGEIIKRHGRSSLDYFKLWPDKTYFFNTARDCFIAYSVGAGFAVALGDPVGPEEKVEETLRVFRQYCEDNGWGVAFHQTLPDFLPHYQRAGFKKLKIGDDAIVDLSSFNLDGPEQKKLRQSIKRLEKAGLQLVRHEPPVREEVLQQLQQVSDEWLSLPGRRERTFSLGLFDRNYVRATPVAVVEDASGRIQAFVNVIPSYVPGTTTVDLMRHRLDAPNSVMDFLFVKHFQQCRALGFNYFDLGMVPLSGFSEKEQASQTERAVYFFLQHLEFIFSFSGLKRFKGKYANRWEPRFVIYRHMLDLPRLGIAMTRIAELNRYHAKLAQIRRILAVAADFPSTGREADNARRGNNG
ncbi:MAG: phosphatidylglycerol lysyltransferase domain-containing protein [Blastocatellales bacterium]